MFQRCFRDKKIKKSYMYNTQKFTTLNTMLLYLLNHNIECTSIFTHVTGLQS